MENKSQFTIHNRADFVKTPPELSGDDVMPEGTVYGFLSTPDGHRLCFGFYVPDNPVSAINIECGTSEHIGKYAETFNRSARAQRATFFMEPYGHGLSARKFDDSQKMSGRDFAKLSEDSYRFITDVIKPVLASRGFDRLPLYGLGCSQGAMRKVFLHHRYPNIEDAMLLGAPMIGQTALSNFAGHLSRRPNFMARYLKFRHGATTEPDVIKTNFEVCFEKAISDPDRFGDSVYWHIHNPELRANKVTLDWITTAASATLRAQDPDFAASIKTPTLFILAGQWSRLKRRYIDDCVDNRAAEDFRSRMANAALHQFKATDHDLLKERPEIRNGVFDLSGEFFSNPQRCIDSLNRFGNTDITAPSDLAIPPLTSREHQDPVPVSA